MDDEAPASLIGQTNVFHATAVEGVNFQTIGGDGEQLMGFVDHEKGCILKEDVKINGRGLLWRGGFVLRPVDVPKLRFRPLLVRGVWRDEQPPD